MKVEVLRIARLRLADIDGLRSSSHESTADVCDSRVTVLGRAGRGHSNDDRNLKATGDQASRTRHDEDTRTTCFAFV